MIMFINRLEELNTLMEINSSKKAELVIIYGRRRVGKTRLLTEFSKKTGALYLLADVSKNVLDILSKQTGEGYAKFGDWEDFFEFLKKSKHKTIIIDEFQYLYKVNKAFPSMLQRHWEELKETDKKIILSGSIISTIYKITQGYGSALYGRKTREINLAPLEFRHIKGFLPHYSTEERIQAYAITGGIPRYLEEIEDEKTIKENIRQHIINKTSFLYNEPLNLLFEEFRDPSPYVSILTAITDGYTKFAEIASASRMEGHKLPKYLTVLERVGIIEKEKIATEKKNKSKNTRYKIKDNFYRFWFTYILRNKSMIELGLEKEVTESIWKNFNAYTGKAFEEVCREYILATKTFKPTNIGRWWHKDNEIDILAINEETKEILFAECKWREKTDAVEVLKELKRKAALVDWRNKDRKEKYLLFAKTFKTKTTDATLIEIKDMENHQ